MGGSRRDILRYGALTALWLAVSAHTPYRQWTVYRRKHLLLLAHRDDPRTYETAKTLAAIFLERLPESKARVTRAPHLHRVASLLATDQMQFAVLRQTDAETMLRGAPPLDPYGKVPLTAIAALDDRVLVARADVPQAHGWLIAQALHDTSHGREPVVSPLRDSDAPFGPLPLHPGAAAYIRGEPLPDRSTAAVR